MMSAEHRAQRLNKKKKRKNGCSKVKKMGQSFVEERRRRKRRKTKRTDSIERGAKKKEKKRKYQTPLAGQPTDAGRERNKNVSHRTPPNRENGLLQELHNCFFLSQTQKERNKSLGRRLYTTLNKTHTRTLQNNLCEHQVPKKINTLDIYGRRH